MATAAGTERAVPAVDPRYVLAVMPQPLVRLDDGEADDHDERSEGGDSHEDRSADDVLGDVLYLLGELAHDGSFGVGEK
jgi:hypothetical protein